MGKLSLVYDKAKLVRHLRTNFYKMFLKQKNDKNEKTIFMFACDKY